MTPRTNNKSKREPEPPPIKLADPIRSPDPLDAAVVLSYADLDHISRTLKKTISTQEQLMSAIAALNTISVEGIPISLEPRLLQRLQTRCLDKPNWPEWLRSIVIRQLHDYCGW